MPAPKNPESYSIVYHKIAQFCMENPLEDLEFSFNERNKAMTFRRNLYGYISALDKRTREKKIDPAEMESLKRRLSALRARKIVLDVGEEEYKVSMIPRDLEDLSHEVESQLLDQWENLTQETDGEEETTQMHKGDPEGGRTATEEAIQRRFNPIPPESEGGEEG